MSKNKKYRLNLENDSSITKGKTTDYVAIATDKDAENFNQMPIIYHSINLEHHQFLSYFKEQMNDYRKVYNIKQLGMIL